MRVHALGVFRLAQDLQQVVVGQEEEAFDEAKDKPSLASYAHS